jgi:hypothetical protein
MLPYKFIEQSFSHLMTTTMQAMHSQNTKLIEVCFSTVAALALPAVEKFKPYYDVCMTQALTAIKSTAQQPAMYGLAAKAIECLGIMCISVGAEVFEKYREHTLSVLIAIHKTDLKPDDPRKDDLEQCLVRICETIREKFSPLIPYVIGKLLQTVASNDECDVQMDGQERSIFEGKEGYRVVQLNTRGSGEKKLIMNIAKVEDKTMTCQILLQYTELLGGLYFPFVQPTVQLMVPLFDYRLNLKIRDFSIRTMPHLMVAAATHFEDKKDVERFVPNLWEFMCGPILDILTSATSLDMQNSILDALTDTIAVLPFQIEAKEIQNIFDICKLLIEMEEHRHKFRVNAANEQDFDEEDAKVIQAEIELEEEGLLKVYDVIAKVSKNAKAACFPAFHKVLFPLVVPLLDTKRSSGTVHAALCIIDDIIEFCGSAAQVYIKDFFPICEQLCSATHVNTRHAAAFGLGACARASGKGFQPLIERSLKALMTSINRPNSRNHENEPATDGAISALGKIVHYSLQDQATSPTVTNVLTLWLDYLPLNADHDESKNMNETLVVFLEQGHPFFSEPKLFVAAVAKLSRCFLRELLMADSLRPRVVAVCKGIAQKIPNLVQHVATGFGQETAQILQQILAVPQ